MAMTGHRVRDTGFGAKHEFHYKGGQKTRGTVDIVSPPPFENGVGVGDTGGGVHAPSTLSRGGTSLPTMELV